MNFRKIFLLIAFVLPLCAFTAHKYYFSVTQADYDSKSQSLKIVTRVFYDDLQKVFQERYDKSIKVDSSYDQDKLDDYIKRYFEQKFIITINGEKRRLHYLGHKDEIDYVVCFIEIENIKNLNSISIENSLLMDLFPEQKNVVHLNTGKSKKSFLLTRDNDKAVLKLSE